jgi:hypothetical protein
LFVVGFTYEFKAMIKVKHPSFMPTLEVGVSLTLSSYEKMGAERKVSISDPPTLEMQ